MSLPINCARCGGTLAYHAATGQHQCLQCGDVITRVEQAPNAPTPEYEPLPFEEGLQDQGE